MDQGINVQEMRGKRFSIIGGDQGGIAVARLLKSIGTDVLVSERKSVVDIKRTAEDFEKLGIRYGFNGDTERILDADYLVVSPGFPSDAYIVRKAKAVGLKVLSEVEVASWFCEGPIIAITGSHGKATTSSLIGAIFRRARIPAVVAGNIRLPFSDHVLDVDVRGVAIIEVACFQLEDTERFKPKIAVLTSIVPDHLDRYSSLEELTASEGKVFRNQTEEDFLIYNDDDEIIKRLVKDAASRKLPFSAKHKLQEGAFIDHNALVCNLSKSEENISNMNEIRVRGNHNLHHSLAATLTARAFEIKKEVIRESLQGFEGVAHRLEFVRDLNGIRYINDSKATNVNSVWYALENFSEPIVWIAGGRDRGNDYTKLFDLVRSKVKAMLLIGEAAETMYEAFHDKTQVIKSRSLQEAVRMAADIAELGDVVLLSPGCASFDMFDGYEQRGTEFKYLVNALGT